MTILHFVLVFGVQIELKQACRLVLPMLDFTFNIKKLSELKNLKYQMRSQDIIYIIF